MADHRPPARLVTGSTQLARRLGAALLPEGRPVAAAARCTGAALGTVSVLNAAHHQPGIMWAAAGAWLIAAWRTAPTPPAAPPPPRRAAAAAARPAAEPDTRRQPDVPDARRQLARAVLHLIGDRPGIHLADLYPRLLNHPAAAHLDETRLRAALLDAGITIHRTLRLPGAEGRSGIKHSDLEALLHGPSPDPLSVPSPRHGDAGQAPLESSGEQAGERPESTPPKRG
ncbi:hypothetical protein RKE29_02095 [Streptomyces sp. B1866]|uniref:hypothetical protein n=1 Tax=Streptomyces sp. B1866 TaxID=3075431 RepID=UPI00288F004D|nr:hypothetical protein [Streptomyces sp. B1866]MDT3395452.1 hypothetical protein [Streptomyces sp. B1866]